MAKLMAEWVTTVVTFGHSVATLICNLTTVDHYSPLQANRCLPSYGRSQQFETARAHRVSSCII